MVELAKIQNTESEFTKNFLTESEFEKFLKAAKKGRHGIRDYALFLFMQRHGLRVSELCQYQQSSLSFDDAQAAIHRLKNGLPTHHPITSDEIRALKRYLRKRNLKWSPNLPWLFVTERGTPFTRQGINYLTRCIGKRAGLDVNPHMMRHTCGFHLANKGYDTRLIQDYLGHRDPKHTVIYTQTAATRFKNLWN